MDQLSVIIPAYNAEKQRRRCLRLSNTGHVSKEQEMKNYAKLLRERMMRMSTGVKCSNLPSADSGRG